MRQLLWKEWHEQAWKLAFGCIVLAAMAAIGLHARMVADATLIEWVAVVGVFILPVLSSTGLMPAERAEGSFEALISMPVRPRQVLAAKAVLGVVLVVGPMAVAAAVSLALAGGREMTAGAMLAFYVRATASAVALLAWMVALTVRLPNEARAALLAVGVVIIWLLLSVALAAPAVRNPAFAASPFAFVYQFVQPDRFVRPPAGRAGAAGVADHPRATLANRRRRRLGRAELRPLNRGRHVTTTTALAWKEWHDARVYLWIGLGLFLGLPLVGMAEQALVRGSGHPELQTSGWVVGLGGVLAVFVGVGVTAPDRRPKLEDFWRSRPVRIGPWLAVKYAVALAVVLCCCGLPPIVAAIVNRHGLDPDMVTTLTFMPFFWTAIFSLAFLCGCLVARPSHAATLALAAMLLVYLLPIVLPPLSFMNVADFADVHPHYPSRGAWHDWADLWGRRQFAFAGGMLVVSAAAAALAAVGVARSWRVESGRRTLYGLVATALLLLFASAAFQLGTNLPILQKVTLPADERVATIVPDPAGGYTVVTATPDPKLADRLRGQYAEPIYHRRHATLDPAGLTVGPPSGLPSLAARDLMWHYLAGTGPTKYWTTTADRADADGLYRITLDWGDPADASPPRTLPLWRSEYASTGTSLVQYGGTLFIIGTPAPSKVDQLTTFDVAHGPPRLVSRQPFRVYPRTGPNLLADDRLLVGLLPLPGVPPVARLASQLDGFAKARFDGHLYVTDFAGVVEAWRLARLDPTAATFDLVGRYRPTLLRRLANPSAGANLHLGPTGLVYVGNWNGGGALNDGVTVLDTAGPRPMREVAHFAAPGADLVCPLPDGRALIAGDHAIWLVAAPRRAG